MSAGGCSSWFGDSSYLYTDWYGQTEGWLPELLEQACKLWVVFLDFWPKKKLTIPPVSFAGLGFLSWLVIAVTWVCMVLVLTHCLQGTLPEKCTSLMVMVTLLSPSSSSHLSQVWCLLWSAAWWIIDMCHYWGLIHEGEYSIFDLNYRSLAWCSCGFNCQVASFLLCLPPVLSLTYFP